jgi:hypothetical protein
MDHAQPPEPPDLSLLLPRSLYYQLVHSLCRSLPPPVEDTPEALAHRDNAAIAQVAAMLPANADEAELAAECAEARIHARDCQREAQAHRDDTAQFLKCHAQATSMLRQAQSARRRLQSLQAERCKREADAAAADRAAWTEHCAIGLMADALGRAPPAPPPDPPAIPQPHLSEPPRDTAAEAEQYAQIYPQRAALIRRLGRLPDNPSFGPPDQDLVRALVDGRSPALLALDDPTAWDKVSVPDP